MLAALSTDASDSAGFLVLDETRLIAMSLSEEDERVQIDTKDFYNSTNLVAGIGDIARTRVYWVDSGHNKIYTVGATDLQLQEVVSGGISAVMAMAVDWVTGNLYWVDATFGTIEVTNRNTSHRAVVLSENITKPNQIVIDARRR